MAPTETALQLVRPGGRAAAPGARPAVQRAPARAAAFDAAQQRCTIFRIAASDYLDPLFLPELVARVKPAGAAARASSCCRCRATTTTGAAWRRGEVDLVIGNWLEPPGETAPRQADQRRDRLPGRRGPPAPCAAARLDQASATSAAEHVAPTPTAPGRARRDRRAPAALGLARQIVVRAPHFGLIPLMVAQTPAGADHRPAVLHPLCRHAAGAHRALPDRVSGR